MKKIVILMSLLSFFLISCNHYYYTPNVQNVPMFIEKNEYRLSASYGIGDEITSGELQSAYSVTNHIALMFNFMKAEGKDDGSANNWGKGYYYEGALGYYKPLGIITPFKSFGRYKPVIYNTSFEVYGGFATCNQHHEYDSYGSISDLAFTKIFIQPSISLTSDIADYALSARISRLSFNKIDYTLSQSGFYSYSKELVEIVNNKNSFLFEPALTLRCGWKYVKLQFQQGVSYNLTDKNLKFDGLNYSIGIYISIANRFKSQPVKEVVK